MRIWSKGNAFVLLVAMYIVSATMENIFKVLKIPYYPEILILGVYPNEMKWLFLRYICILMFIAALLIITEVWKQTKCPSQNEWIRKCATCIQWNIIQPWKWRNSSFATTWMKLYGIIVKCTQTHTDSSWCPFYVEYKNNNNKIKRVKFIETQNRMVATGSWGWKNWGMLGKVYEISLKR